MVSPDGRQINRSELTDDIKIVPSFKINTSILSNMVLKKMPIFFLQVVFKN